MNRKLKTMFSILLILTLAMAFFACGKATDDKPSSNTSNDPGSSTTTSTKDTVTIAVTQDSGTLDPMIITGVDLVYGLHMIYDQLWYTDENANEVMMLATGREKINNLTYRITLREGVTFSNGSAFEADDVLYSLDHANNRPGQPAILPQLDVPNCTIIDANTIELVFTEYRISVMDSIGALCMLDKQTCEADPDALSTNPVGTGPYELKEYVINSHMNITRRDEYWGTMPAIKNYSFVQLKEESQRVNALETGEVDIAGIPFHDIEYVKSLDGTRIDQTNGFMGSGIYFNISPSSIFYENTDARKAVAYAIDRDSINTLVYSGTGTKPTAPVQGTCTDGDASMFNIGIYGDDYDIELAKQLVESSGLAGKSIRLINNGSATAAMTSELIQADCKAVGITVEVITLDMGTWTTYLFDETQYDMCIDGVPIAGASFSGSYLFCYDYMAAGSYLNYEYKGKDVAFPALRDAVSNDNVDERIKLNYELAKACADEMLWYNLVAPSDALGMAADLKGNVRNGYNVVSLYRNLSWS